MQERPWSVQPIVASFLQSASRPVTVRPRSVRGHKNQTQPLESPPAPDHARCIASSAASPQSRGLQEPMAQRRLFSGNKTTPRPAAFPKARNEPCAALFPAATRTPRPKGPIEPKTPTGPTCQKNSVRKLSCAKQPHHERLSPSGRRDSTSALGTAGEKICS